MTEVFIKYNPYKLETEITIDGKRPAEDSLLSIRKDTRLQAWIEDLPRYIREDYNTTKAKVVFHGTILDYEDVVSAVEKSKSDGMEIECEHTPAKEAGDKIAEINSLFEEVKDRLFVANESASDEYKETVKDARARVEKAFKQVSDNKFEVAVIATISAGKSMLINALLHQKIMPTSQEACTAKIMRVTDNDELPSFKASAYDENGEPVGSTRTIDNIEVMKEMNADPRVCRVEVEGSIPFVSAKGIKLVLVDTPGPNATRNLEYRAKVYEMLVNSTNTLVLYVMDACQFQTNDDSQFLEFVLEQTKIGGKQSKDRFIFVINKLDAFNPNEDSVDDTIENVKRYLKEKGVEEPNIYPASALTALNIRYLIERVGEIDEDTRDETELYVKKFNRNEMLHLETKMQLTPSTKAEIKKQLDAAKKDGDANKEALIHSGIISIENAIKAFVEKYAKSAKIRNLVATFNKELESAMVTAKLEEEIDTDEHCRKQVLWEINIINKKLNDGQEAKKFRKEIDGLDCHYHIEDIVADEVQKAREAGIKLITEHCNFKKEDLTTEEAANLCLEFDKFVGTLMTSLMVVLDRKVEYYFEETKVRLSEQYRKNLNDLTVELKSVSGAGISIISLKDMMARDVEVSVDLAKRKYIKSGDLARDVLLSIEQQLDKIRKTCIKYSKCQIDAIKEFFKEQFDELDDIIKAKTSELERFAKDRENIDARIKTSKERRAWITSVINRVEAIFEI